MRWIFLLALLLPAQARAQFMPCPSTTIGWSQSWTTGSLTSAAYDSQSQLLFVVFNYKTVSAYSNVPYGVIQGFTSTSNPTAYYNSAVVPRYHALALSEQVDCPLLFEDGRYIWTK